MLRRREWQPSWHAEAVDNVDLDVLFLLFWEPSKEFTGRILTIGFLSWTGLQSSFFSDDSPDGVPSRPVKQAMVVLLGQRRRKEEVDEMMHRDWIALSWAGQVVPACYGGERITCANEIQ